MSFIGKIKSILIKFHSIKKSEGNISSVNIFNDDNIKKLKILFNYVNPYLKSGIIGSLLIFFGFLVSIPQPLFTKYIIDDVIITKNISMLSFVILVLLILIILEAIVALLRSYIFLNFEQNILFDIQMTVFDKIISAPKSFFDEQNVGNLMSRINYDVSMLKIFFSGGTVNMALNVFKFFGGIAILFVLHVKLALISLLSLPFFLCSGIYFGDRQKAISHIALEKTAGVSGKLQESFSGIIFVKSLAKENDLKAEFSTKLKDAISFNIDKSIFSQIGNSFSSITASIGGIIVIFFGSYEIIMNRLTLGSFIAFTAYLGYLYNPARSLINSYGNFQAGFAALDRVCSILDLFTERDLDACSIFNSSKKLSGAIEFNKVSFSYNHNNKYNILTNISFKIKAGQKVAFVGHTGSGKTTIANLLLRYYQPQSGNIMLDGNSIEKYDLKCLRRNIGIVSQDIFLFNDTIYNNIKYSCAGADSRDVISAAANAGAIEFIEELPEGFDTIIGPNGVRLSAGQKQRISIARVLISNPNIYIFDEPTSSLDPITESVIWDTIIGTAMRKTVIVIAHHLSTIKQCDKIFFLKDGRIFEEGTHTNLLYKNGLYQEMFDAKLTK